jgi:glycosyltransferase involved in cell wall biosynthesis
VVEIPVRILMLSDLYPPSVGGMEQYASALSQELAARGHEVSVATLEHQFAPSESSDGLVRVHRIKGTFGRMPGLFSDPRRTMAPPLADPEMVLALGGILRRERPHIVHAHNWAVNSFAPLKAWSNARLVLTLHDYSFVCAKKTMLRHGQRCVGPGPRCLDCAAQQYGALKASATLLALHTFNRIAARAIDMFLPVSASVARASRLAESHLPYKVIHPFAPEEDAAQRPSDGAYLSELPDEPFILFVGALVPFKGFDVLLDAFQQLPQPPPLVLIGMERLDTPRGKLPASVRVLRNWPHRLVLHAWRRAMLGVIPSIGPEGFPLVALEAMAAGRPVVASDIAGLNEAVVHGTTGLLVPPGDPAALRDALQCLLSDTDLRANLGTAALAHSKRFRAAETVAHIEDVYHTLLATHPATSAPRC